MPCSGGELKRLDYRINEWDHDFMRYIRALEKRKPVVLTGDLNVAHNEIDIYDPAKHHKIPGFAAQERASFNAFLKSGSGGFFDTYRYFYPSTRKYTFWPANHISLAYNSRLRNKGWRLDYFVLSKSFMPYAVDSLIHNDYLGSDHCPIEL